VISFSLLIVETCKSQTDGLFAFPVLNYDYLTSEIGMSGAFSSLPNPSISSAWYNPAQLGYKTDYSLALAISPYNDLFSTSSNISNVGLRFQQESRLFGNTIQWGISLHQFSLNSGELDITTIEHPEGGIGTINFIDKVQSLSIGLGTTIVKGLRLNAGYSLKKASYSTTIRDNTEMEDTFISCLMSDFGFITDVNIPELSNWQPMLFSKSINWTIRLSYTVRNIGKDVDVELDRFGKLPLPKTSILGFSTSFSIPHVFNDIQYDFLKLHISRDARNIDMSNYSRDVNISLFDQLFLGKTGFWNQINQGIRLDFIESIELSLGQIKRKFTDDSMLSYGLTLDLKGWKKFKLDQTFPLLKPITVRINQTLLTHKTLENTYFFGIEIGYRF